MTYEETIEWIFLSTLSLRRATLNVCRCTTTHTYFYPRSPCGERQTKADSTEQSDSFLSTLSLRRATWRCRMCPHWTRDFYPRSPCGERPQDAAPVCPGLKFLSTLSLRRATDTIRKTQRPYVFLSTLSLRRATTAYEPAVPHCCISIHALLAESDV